MCECALPALCEAISRRGPDFPAAFDSCERISIPVDCEHTCTSFSQKNACQTANEVEAISNEPPKSSFNNLSDTFTASSATSLRIWAAVLHRRGLQAIPQPLVISYLNNGVIEKEKSLLERGDHNEKFVFAWNGEYYGHSKALHTDEYESLRSTTVLTDKNNIAVDKASSHAVSSLCSLIQGIQVDRDVQTRLSTENDTLLVGKLLSGCKTEAEILSTLNSLEGPFAFLFYSAHTQQLWFGRDKLGRRSLLFAYTDDGGICLSSVGCNPPFINTPPFSSFDNSQENIWMEVPVGGVFAINFSAWPAHSNLVKNACKQPYSDECYSLSVSQSNVYPAVLFHPWPTPPPFLLSSFWELSLNDSTKNAASRNALNASEGLLHHLREAVRKRLVGLDHRFSKDESIGILFSGGLDSTLLACILLEQTSPMHCVELLNVCFDPLGFSSDRLTALSSFAELVALFPLHTIKLICVDISEEELLAAEKDIFSLISPCSSHMDFNIGAALYFASRGCGRLCTQKFQFFEKDLYWETLFNSLMGNGRVSSSLPNRYKAERPSLPPSLIGEKSPHLACFLCLRKAKEGCVHGSCSLCCLKLRRFIASPFSFSHISSWMDLFKNASLPLIVLAQASPSIETSEPTKFVCFLVENRFTTEMTSSLLDNVKQIVETSLLSSTLLSDNPSGLQSPSLIVSPSRSCVDSSPASDNNQKSYQSSSKVLFVGTGADELLGGYGRHQTAQRVAGSKGIKEELL
ncbi:asparagine synthase, partial [Cardiosporidium cionae]